MIDIHAYIEESIGKAAGQGQALVQIPTGTYRIDKSVIIADAENITIDGGGSTFVFTDAQNAGFELLRTRNVCLSNLEVDYDPLPYTQGTIVAIHPEGKWYDLQIDKGYRRDPPFFLKDEGGDLGFHFFDPKTREVNRNACTINPLKISFPKEDVIRFEPAEAELEWNNVHLGDLAATSHSWSGVAIRLMHCAYTKVENVTLYTSAGAGIMERFGHGGADLSFRIMRGKTPEGATAPRLFSTPRDGFHTTGTVQGAYVHDTHIEYNGDDGLNFWALFFRVTGIEEDTKQLTLSTILGDIGADPVLLNADDAVTLYDGGTARRKGEAAIASTDGLTVVLDNPNGLDVQAGDFLLCPQRVARGARIENNTFRNIDGIGLLLKAPGAVVHNNQIQGMAHAGMWVGCYLGGTSGYLEGPFPEDLTIQGNTIGDTGFGRLCRSDWFQASSGIHVGHVTDLPEVHRCNREMKNIAILDNTISDSTTFGILVSNAEGVRVAGNILTNSNCGDPFFVPEVLSIRKNAAIVVKSSGGVTLTGNTVSNPGTYSEADVFIDE